MDEQIVQNPLFRGRVDLQEVRLLLTVSRVNFFESSSPTMQACLLERCLIGCFAFLLVQLLLASDFELVSAFCEVCIVLEDGKTNAEALVDLFEANRKTERLMEWAISKELAANRACFRCLSFSNRYAFVRQSNALLCLHSIIPF